MERMRPLGWQADALCREHPEVVFVPTDGKLTAKAFELCRRCIVRRECVTSALEYSATVGCWGATTTESRAKARASHLTVDELIAQTDAR
jgi:WhiB family transcriptional regulator, redox-sensing transcriptional regulator